MSELENCLSQEDALYMDKLSQRMDRHQIGPELFLAVGRTVSRMFLRMGELYAANYSLDLPRRDGDETLS